MLVTHSQTPNRARVWEPLPGPRQADAGVQWAGRSGTGRGGGALTCARNPARCCRGPARPGARARAPVSIYTALFWSRALIGPAGRGDTPPPPRPSRLEVEASLAGRELPAAGSGWPCRTAVPFWNVGRPPATASGLFGERVALRKKKSVRSRGLARARLALLGASCQMAGTGDKAYPDVNPGLP